MKRLSVEEAQLQFRELVDYVRSNNQPVLIEHRGQLVAQIVPCPKPVGEFKGKPKYNLNDLQFLDAPWWFE